MRSRGGITFAIALAVAAGVSSATTVGASAAPLTSPGWRVVPGIAASSFSAVVATSPTSAWAFGSTSTTGPIVAWRLDGATWSKAPFPASPRTAYVRMASASGPSSVYVATSRGALLRWDGAAWRTVAVFAAVAGLAVTGPGDVWVSGLRTPSRASNGLWHLTAGRWRRASPTSYGGLVAVSDTSLFAVTRSDVAAFDGSRWTLTSLASLLPPKRFLCDEPGLDAIEALTPTDLWVTASGNCQDFGGPLRLLHHVGSTWSIASIQPAYSSGALCAAGGGSLWITTGRGEGSGTTMLRLAHGRIGPVALPLTTGGRVLYLSSVATAPGTTSSFAVGEVIRGSNFVTSRGVILQYRSST